MAGGSLTYRSVPYSLASRARVAGGEASSVATDLHRNTIQYPAHGLVLAGGRARRGEDVKQLTSQDYENLLAFRTSLRRFLHWSQSEARAAGLTPAQHQLLLAIKGHRGGPGPTVGDLAGYLLLRHHSAVELVDRAEGAGLVERGDDAEDGRVTRVRLTPEGERRLSQLTPAHLDELRRLAPMLEQLLSQWPPPGLPG
jgi:DNA-binding MarR family transcriptional regulator